jgi:hypothetical protein
MVVAGIVTGGRQLFSEIENGGWRIAMGAWRRHRAACRNFVLRALGLRFDYYYFRRAGTDQREAALVMRDSPLFESSRPHN